MERKIAFNIDSYCRDNYRQTVFTAVFSFVAGYGELLFASLEFVPKFLGVCYGLNDEQQVKVKGRRLFFLRHVIDDVPIALEMYRQTAQTGQIQMLWQNDSPINMMPYIPEPKFSSESISASEPKRSK